MTEDDLSLDPNIYRKKYVTPPGQTRHVYLDDNEDETSGKPDTRTADDIKGDDTIDDEKVGLRKDIDEDDTILDDEDHISRKTIKRRKRKEAPKPRKEPRVQEASFDESSPLLVRVLMDRRVAIWLGLFFFLLGCAVVVVLLSTLKSGSLDQSLVMNLIPSEILESGQSVKSSVGAGGAWFGHVLFAESFGIGAFVIAAYFLILGWNMLFGRKFGFWGLTFRCALLAVAVSIVLGLITYAAGTETFWGGVHGHYINKWLLDMTGIPGALFVSLLLIGTLVAVYINELTRFYKGWKKRSEERRLLRIEQQESMLAERAQAAKETTDEAESQLESEVTASSDTPAASSNTLAASSDTPATSSDTTNDNLPLSKVENNDKESHKPSGVAFVIDAPTQYVPQEDLSVDKSDITSKNEEKEVTGEIVETEPANSEPGFEIDVPVSELGKGSGSVAEKLVAEQGEYDPRAELSRFKFPTLDLLADKPIKGSVDTEELEANKDRIIKTLGNYGITIETIKATVGPTVTLYEIIPTEGIRIAQIKRLEDDIALSLAAKGIRIIAPMPGKGTVGIEVPNSDPQVVSMRGILASKKFRESKANLPIALGATISNEVFVTDLAAMPHALVAGATGQGKSVGLNVLISSLLFRKHPSELKFVLIDPKMVEFSVYERLRGHYLAALPGEEDAIVTDSSKVLGVLNSLCVEMDNRYALLRKAAVVKIEEYNKKFCQRRLSTEKGHRYMPYIVVVIDEFADLIMTGGKEIEMPVMRITQKARAVGIHMIIATQRPSTNVLTGLIKANCPSRIAFRVLQNVDSRTILDRPGAEQLIGRGDMLYSQGGDMERIQCAFISSQEIESICDSIDAQPGYEKPYPLPEVQADTLKPGGAGIAGAGHDRDPLFDEAARFVVLSATASTSSLQRRFEIGYNRAGKIMDQMEAAGFVGPASGSKPRSVLIDPEALERILANR